MMNLFSTTGTLITRLQYYEMIMSQAKQPIWVVPSTSVITTLPGGMNIIEYNGPKPVVVK